MKYWRDLGYVVDKTEHWNSYARIRQDLFGIIDIVAIGKKETVGIQTTSYSNIGARVKKIMGSQAYPVLKASGWRVLVQGWHKRKVGGHLKFVDKIQEC